MAKMIFPLLLLFLPGMGLGAEPVEVKRLRCEVLAEYPRTHPGYTQGFFILGGKLYESTGGYGASQVRRFDLESQRLEQSVSLPPDVFGEGITPFGKDKILQLTWRRGLGFVYDRKSLQVESVFRYGTEGWGISAQGERLVMSDGTDRLIFLNPENYQKEQVVRVRRNGKKQEKLNELEWVGSVLYANVWLEDTILRIIPETGEVSGVIDCSGLCPERPNDADAVLNGIAYDPAEEVFYLTGKLWPTLYKVRFVAK